MKPITMKDVAKLAKLSEMTVSRVLTGKGYASEAAEKKVLAAAEQLGYVPNRLAGSLASSRSNLVGVVLPAISNAVFVELMSGIYAGLENKGLQPVFGISEYSKAKEEQLIKDMMSWRPAGLIVTGLEHTGGARSLLKAASKNVVEVIDVDGDPVASCIGLSHKKAGSMMAEHLIAKGYRRFGYIGSNMHIDLRACKRRDAFFEAVLASGGEIVAELAPKQASSMSLGRETTKAFLEQYPNVEAIYYASDDMASGGLMYAISAGMKLPDDVALASFNGLSFTDSLPLKITTVRSPRFEIGRLAGDYIASQAVADTEGRHSAERQKHHVLLELGLTLEPGDTT